MIKLFYYLGLFSIPIIICSLLLIVIIAIKTTKIFSSSSPSEIKLIGIWLTGLISFLIGTISNIFALTSLFYNLSHASNDQIPILIAENFRRSYISSYIGLSLFIFSLICWGILKGIANSRAKK